MKAVISRTSQTFDKFLLAFLLDNTHTLLEISWASHSLSHSLYEFSELMFMLYLNHDFNLQFTGQASMVGRS